MKIRTLQNIALFIFFFSINFEVWDPTGSGYLSISKITGFLYFVTLVPQLQSFLKMTEIKAFMKPLLLFFLLLTVMNIINVNFISSEVFDFSIFQNLILLILLYNHNRKEPKILEKAMLAYGIGSIFFALLFYMGIGVESSTDGRIQMFGDNENVIGVRMCISTIYLVYFILQNPLKIGPKRFYLSAGFPFMFLLLVATGSRVAFLSFAASFITATALFKSKRFYWKLLFLLIGIIIGVYLWSYITVSGTLYDRLLRSVNSEDLSDRNIIWNSILPLIKANPILGVGTTGYGLFCYTTFGRFVSPHNVILEILCYTGCFGLLIYLFFLFKVVKKSYIGYKTTGTIVELLLLIPILGTILSAQILLLKIGWVLYAYIISKKDNQVDDIKVSLVKNRRIPFKVVFQK
jgi:O-antigen ligase